MSPRDACRSRLPPFVAASCSSVSRYSVALIMNEKYPVKLHMHSGFENGYDSSHEDKGGEGQEMEGEDCKGSASNRALTVARGQGGKGEEMDGKDCYCRGAPTCLKRT